MLLSTLTLLVGLLILGRVKGGGNWKMGGVVLSGEKILETKEAESEAQKHKGRPRWRKKAEQ